jgi:predicted P-loop ATPase
VQSIKRLLLPQRTDINDLLFDGNLEGFLVDDNNYKVIVDNCSLNETEQQETNEKNEEKPQELTKNQEIEEFIMDRYDVRFNAIKQQPEYCIKNEDKIFQPIDKYVLNSLRRELNQHGLNTSVLNLKSILESDFAKMVHPIREYFNSLPPWDEEADHIKELANTVIVGNPEIWQEYFQKWLVAVVANTLNNQGCQNHTCLVITGKQGAFKTTWLDHLCPKNLSQYLFTGKIDPQNKDSLTYIAECFLINIDDQLRQLNKRDENELKNLITTPFVKYRRPYDIYITEYPHTASFMASVNGNDFLTDPTGSRRFLPFEAIEIDINAAKAIDMDLVYAQAMHLYKSDFRYWFDHKEIEELHTHNQAFQVVSIEEQLVLEYFDKPDERESATDYLQSAVIQSYLENLIRSRLSPKKLGEALTKLGFEKWQRTKDGKTKWVWSVIKKEIPQVDQENNNNPF